MVGVDDDLLLASERIRLRLKAEAAELGRFVDELSALTAQLVEDTRGGEGDDDDAASE